MNKDNLVRQYLFELIKQYKWFLIGLACVSLSGGAFGTFVNYQVKEIIDAIADNANISLISATFLFVLYTACNHLVFFISRLLEVKYKPRMLIQIVETAYTRTMNHSLHWFDSHLSGEIASKISDLQDSIITCITVVFRSLTMFFFILIGMIMLFRVHYTPGIVLLVFLAIYTPIMIKLLQKQLKLQQEYVKARQVSVGIINDSISNVFGIKIIGNLVNEMRLKLLPSVKIWSEWDRKTRIYDAWFVDMADTIMSVIMNAAQILVLGYLYKSGEISAGEFAFIAGISIQMHCDLDTFLENIMFSINPKISTIRASLEFIYRQHDVVNGDKEMPRVRGEIEYKNVNFSYDGQKNIFFNLNLKIPIGQKIGIVGTSGAGKTTLVKCLLRYFELQSGQICIDGHDITEYTEESVRANIAVIPQDITMFHRTILENLQIANANASLYDIQEACRKARIHNDIERMSNGYNTIVGERGVKLSGGQRQRIGIARAILKNAPILILDEATSALDTPTELLIQESLLELISGSAQSIGRDASLNYDAHSEQFSSSHSERSVGINNTPRNEEENSINTGHTTIVIAHRLSTILHMDRIIVMENGEIIESGTHDELLANGRTYTRLWNSQINGFVT